MKQFSDWDREISDEELNASMNRYIELLNEFEAQEQESEVEARLGRAEAYHLAGETADPAILAAKAAEYFNRTTFKVNDFLTVMANTAINDGMGTPTIQFFFENLYNLAYLLDYIVDNVRGIFSGAFDETEGADADYSAAVAKMGMQAVTGAIFAAVHEVLSTDHALIPEIMQEADEDMTLYDIMKMVKEDYLLVERAIDFEPTGGEYRPPKDCPPSRPKKPVQNPAKNPKQRRRNNQKKSRYQKDRR